MNNIGSEQVVTMTEARKLLPCRLPEKKPNVAALYRWADAGVRGIRLESIMVRGTRCTSIATEQLGKENNRQRAPIRRPQRRHTTARLTRIGSQQLTQAAGLPLKKELQVIETEPRSIDQEPWTEWLERLGGLPVRGAAGSHWGSPHGHRRNPSAFPKTPAKFFDALTDRDQVTAERTAPDLA